MPNEPDIDNLEGQLLKWVLEKIQESNYDPRTVKLEWEDRDGDYILHIHGVPFTLAAADKTDTEGS